MKNGHTPFSIAFKLLLYQIKTVFLLLQQHGINLSLRHAPVRCHSLHSVLLAHSPGKITLHMLLKTQFRKGFLLYATHLFPVSTFYDKDTAAK